MLGFFPSRTQFVRISFFPSTSQRFRRFIAASRASAILCLFLPFLIRPFGSFFVIFSLSATFCPAPLLILSLVPTRRELPKSIWQFRADTLSIRAHSAVETPEGSCALRAEVVMYQKYIYIHFCPSPISRFVSFRFGTPISNFGILIPVSSLAAAQKKKECTYFLSSPIYILSILFFWRAYETKELSEESIELLSS